METQSHAPVRTPEAQPSTRAHNRTCFGNALKHGLRSTATLLPDEDAAEFHRLRHDQFHTYRPKTRDEAQCVEVIVTSQWRIARCRRWQSEVDAHVDALMYGTTPPGHICDPDQHRWFHKSKDCVDQESRLHRMECRARDKLLLLQKLRRAEQIAGTVAEGPIFGYTEPTQETSAVALQGGPQPAAQAGGSGNPQPVPSTAPSPSPDGGIRKSDERTSVTPEPTLAHAVIGTGQSPAPVAAAPFTPGGALPWVPLRVTAVCSVGTPMTFPSSAGYAGGTPGSGW